MPVLWWLGWRGDDRDDIGGEDLFQDDQTGVGGAGQRQQSEWSTRVVLVDDLLDVPSSLESEVDSHKVEGKNVERSTTGRHKSIGAGEAVWGMGWTARLKNEMTKTGKKQMPVLGRRAATCGCEYSLVMTKKDGVASSAVCM